MLSNGQNGHTANAINGDCFETTPCKLESEESKGARKRKINRDNEQNTAFLGTGEGGLIPARSVESIYIPNNRPQTMEEQDDSIEERDLCDSKLRLKWLRTLLLILGYMGTGMTYTVPGPSLIDLEIRTGGTTKEITFMFTLRAFGGLLASLLSGPLYDAFNADIIMGVGYAFGCVCIVMAPWWTNLMAMCVSIGLAGFFSAAMNIGVNYCCIGIWGKRNPPFLLLLSFMNHVASAAIPPVVKLLLLPSTPAFSLNGNSTTTSLASVNASLVHSNYSTIIASANASHTSVSMYTPDDVMVQYAFMLPGAAYAICCVTHLLLFFCSGCRRSSSYTGKIKLGDGEASEKKAVRLFPGSLAYTVLMLSMFAVMSGSQGTLEETFYMFLFTYLVKHLGWSKGEAALINTVLLLASFISLLLFMVIARFIRPNFIIIILVSCILLPCIGLCAPVTKVLIWVAIGCVAVGLGPLGASVVSWMNSCFPMQGKLTAFFFFTVYVSRMIASFTVGHVFTVRGLGWFVYINVMIVTAGFSATIMANLFTEVPFFKKRLPSGMVKVQEECIEVKPPESNLDAEKSNMLTKRT